MSPKASLGGSQFDSGGVIEESLYHSQYCVRILRWCCFPTSSPVLTPRWEEPVSFTNVISREARTVRPHLDPSLNHIIQDLSPPAAGCCDSNIDRTLRGIDSSVVSGPVDICNCQLGSRGVLPEPRFFQVVNSRTFTSCFSFDTPSSYSVGHRGHRIHIMHWRQSLTPMWWSLHVRRVRIFAKPSSRSI